LGIGSDTGGFEVRLGDQRQLDLLAEALELLGDEHPALRSRLLARWSVAATNMASADERAAWADGALALARQVGDPTTLASALSVWCDANARPSSTRARLAAAAEMLTVGAEASDGEAMLMARRFRIVALLEQGDPAVHEEIDRFASLAESLGQPLYRWYVPLFRGLQALLRGDLQEAERRSGEAEALGAEAGSANAHMLAGTQAAAVGFERGHIAELAEAFTQALAENEWMRDLPIAVSMAALIDVGFRRDAEALSKLAWMAGERFAFVPFDSEWLSTLSGIAAATIVLDDPVSAAPLYDVLLPFSGSMVVDGIAASCLDSVDYLLGRLALVIGRTDDAARHLQSAIEQSRRLGAVLLEAHAEHALGLALDDEDPVRAQRHRAAAESVMLRCGARPLLVFGMARGAVAEPLVDGGAVFRQDGSAWSLTFEGDTVRVADAKGLHDLRYLLSHPGQPVPAAALQQSVSAQKPGPPSAGVEVLDDQARDAYRSRLRDLDEDIADADADNDPERAARAQEERDFLLAELSAAVGLGGRARRLGDDGDRARKAVTMRIRNAIDRIGRVHPQLARHLTSTVSTGRLCSYEPEHPVDWTV
jgi:tetratricopeptide (TPR) repeat protein